MKNTEINIFSWNEEKKYDGTTYPIDTLNRARYASFLTNFLIPEASNGGYVLNINAPWGTGKTYFLNRWLIDLKKNHPVVYVDAWKQDFSNDPMLSVVSSIISQLKEFQPNEQNTIGNTVGKVGGFIKDIAPIVAKGVMKKATGIDLNDDGEQDLSKADATMLGDIAAKVTDKMIKNHNATLNSITTFKKAIQDWIGAIQGNTKLKAPAFIFIDELDRCRPTYAVQMLEVIKHFFEMDNIIFVVATDTEQLQHAIKAVYGQGFDAQTYLGRFFHRRCTLQNISKEHFINNYITQKFKLTEVVFKELETWPKLRGKEDLINLVIQLEVVFDLSLRDLEQLIDKVIAVVLITDKKVNIIFLVYLFMLHECNKNIYDEIVNRNSETFEGMLDNNGGVLKKISLGKLRFTREYIAPISDTTSTVFTLFEILTAIIDSFALGTTRLENKITELSQVFHGGYLNNNLHKKNTVLLDIYRYDDNFDNYKNWIELAVSFDA